MIAALFVETGGAYFGLPDVDPWDVTRDARLYRGPYPVVAHPPCARWGRMAETAFGYVSGKKRGDDDGCFASALASVNEHGGVLEHPEASTAWRAHGLLTPPRNGGWLRTGSGWTCCVEQGHYGHKTRKATWLYVVGPLPSDLIWGASKPEGYEPCAKKGEAFTKMSKRQRSATPPAFRDLLLSIARTASARAA